MDTSQITKTADDAVELFQVVMRLYTQYFDTLEIFIKNVPETETEVLKSLNQHLMDVQSALEHDLGVFYDAINRDKEDVSKIKDKLKIESIYKNLNL